MKPGVEMYTDEDIGSAVQAGVLSEETAQNFRAYVSSQRGVAFAEEEQFRVKLSVAGRHIVGSSSSRRQVGQVNNGIQSTLSQRKQLKFCIKDNRRNSQSKVWQNYKILMSMKLKR